MMTTEEMLAQILDGQNSINQRLDTMDKRFDTIDKRFDEVNAKFEEVNAKFEDVNSRFDEVNAKFEEVNSKFDEVNAKFEEVYFKIDEVHDIESELLNRQDNFQKDVNCIKITLENNITPAIKLLADVQVENSGRFTKLEKNVEFLMDNLAITEVLEGLNQR